MQLIPVYRVAAKSGNTGEYIINGLLYYDT